MDSRVWRSRSAAAWSRCACAFSVSAPGARRLGFGGADALAQLALRAGVQEGRRRGRELGDDLSLLHRVAGLELDALHAAGERRGDHVAVAHARLAVMFQLSKQELANLKSQIVISSLLEAPGWGGRRSAPYAFSEQGVAMLSSVLRSARAIAVNIAIMRAFVRLRQLAAAGSELAKKLDELESRVSGHDRDIAAIVRAIRELANPSVGKPRRPIGFVS